MNELDKRMLESVLEQLAGLGDGSIEPEQPSVGICSYLEAHLYDEFGDDWDHTCQVADAYSFRLVSAFSAGWEKYTGEYDYPVPHPQISSPMFAYQKLDDLWSGGYGDNRRELASFLAGELEEALKSGLDVAKFIEEHWNTWRVSGVNLIWRDYLQRVEG